MLGRQVRGSTWILVMGPEVMVTWSRMMIGSGKEAPDLSLIDEFLWGIWNQGIRCTFSTHLSVMSHQKQTKSTSPDSVI